MTPSRRSSVVVQLQRLLIDFVWPSLRFDVQLLRIRHLPRKARVRFIAEKYLALACLAGGHPWRMRATGHPFLVASRSSVGTLQSCVVDLAGMWPHIAPDVQAGGAVIDVGANVGQFCHALRWFAPEAPVHSIEADPVVFEALRANVGGMAGVTVSNAAVAATGGRATFHRAGLDLVSTLHPDPDLEYLDSIEVDTAPLDGLVAPGRIAVVKVDVEGAEREVIEGASAVLAGASWLLIEVSLSRASSLPLDDVVPLVQTAAPDAMLHRRGRTLSAGDRPLACDLLIRLRKL